MAQLKRLDPETNEVMDNLNLGTEGLLIGRDHYCGYVLPLQDVSRRHAWIGLREGEWLVKDLGSVNGTYVNLHRVEEAVLNTGDRIRIAKCLFVFDDLEPKVAVDVKTHAMPHVSSKTKRTAFLVGGFLVSLGILGWALWSPKGLSINSSRPRAQVSNPHTVPLTDHPFKTWNLSIHLKATGRYNQRFDSPDQEWPEEQELELEIKDILIRNVDGILKGQSQSRLARDEVECGWDGNRLSHVIWRASRRMTRTMEDHRELPARDELWILELPDLGPPATIQKTMRSYEWTPRPNSLPRFAHQVTFYPENTTIHLLGVSWIPEGKGSIPASVKVVISDSDRTPK